MLGQQNWKSVEPVGQFVSLSPRGGEGLGVRGPLRQARNRGRGPSPGLRNSSLSRPSRARPVGNPSSPRGVLSLQRQREIKMSYQLLGSLAPSYRVLIHQPNSIHFISFWATTSKIVRVQWRRGVFRNRPLGTAEQRAPDAKRNDAYASTSVASSSPRP